jgi:spore coat protein A
MTRLNVVAGLAGFYLIRDPTNNVDSNLPKGKYEIPIVIQDKIFVGPNTINNGTGIDPEWANIVPQIATNNGSLWYAHEYDTGRWSKGPGTPPSPVSAIPEFFGDTMLVNGTVFPKATVEARRYRLRLLDACNARVLNLQLYVDDGSPNGITLDANGFPTNTPFVNAAAPNGGWLQIGTEGGFLSQVQVRFVVKPTKLMDSCTNDDNLFHLHSS